MIVTEHYRTRKDGINLHRTYSDTGHYIRQMETGIVYEEAIDIGGAPYTYEETEDVINAEQQLIDADINI